MVCVASCSLDGSTRGNKLDERSFSQHVADDQDGEERVESKHGETYEVRERFTQ